MNKDELNLAVLFIVYEGVSQCGSSLEHQDSGDLTRKAVGNLDVSRRNRTTIAHAGNFVKL